MKIKALTLALLLPMSAMAQPSAAPEYWRPVSTPEEREVAGAELEAALADSIVASRFACSEHQGAVRRYNEIAASAYFRFTHHLALNPQATLNEGFLAIAGSKNHLNFCKGGGR